MKVFLMLLFLTSFTSQIKINKLYNPRVLPRGQYYEVAHLKKENKQYCFMQYLAEDYRQSFWGVKVSPISSNQTDCRELVDNSPFLKKYLNSEVFKIFFDKKKSKINFILSGDKRLEWIFTPWNFQENHVVTIQDNQNKDERKSADILKLEEAILCESYTRFPQCQQINKLDCTFCPNGWSYAVGSGCQLQNKVCANSCGAREQIACPQGRVDETQSLNLVCPHQIEGAICHQGLTAYCYEDIVYCK